MAMAAVQYPPTHNLTDTRSHTPASRAFRYNASLLSSSTGKLPSLSASAYSTPSNLLHERQQTQAEHDEAAGQSSVISQGAFVAAKHASDQSPAKLQKRSSVGSSKGSFSNPRSVLATSSSLQSPSIDSSETPLPPIRQSSAKDRFKLNLRKLAQQKRDEYEQPTLDLSQTAEENERRSGLGIYLREQTAQSLPQPASPLGAATAALPHSRNVSYTSQQSGSSMSFKPTVPFTLPNRSSSLTYTPPPPAAISQSYSTSIIDIEDSYGDVNHSYIGSIEGTPNSIASKPFHRSNTDGAVTSTPRFAMRENATTLDNRSTSTHVQTITGRARGNTNQSIDTVSTPKSYGSLDRAFSFMTGGVDKNEPIDPARRQASIQAARQAFEEHEMAKAAKHEQREKKAAQKARKREARLGTLRGRKGTSQQKMRFRKKNSSPSLASRPEQLKNQNQSEETAEGVAYLSMPAGPAPSQSERTWTRRQSPGSNKQQRTTLKNRYLRFLSWLRTKLIRFGRPRRRVVA